MVRDILKMDDVRIINRNFTGRKNTYNREGDRNFCVVIDDPELAQRLSDDGWNVKIKAPRHEDDSSLHFMQVKVKFNDEAPRLNPSVYLRSGKNMRKLDEDSIHRLDDVDIERVDLDIRPFNYDVQGKTGISAYLVSICVTQRVNRFEERYGEEGERV